MKYEPVEQISKSEAETIFETGDQEQISRALVGLAFHCDDWRWVQSQCLHYLKSENEDLQQTAILCLGHLARIHHQLDLELIMPALAQLRHNPNLQGRVEDTLDDIKIFITKAD